MAGWREGEGQRSNDMRPAADQDHAFWTPRGRWVRSWQQKRRGQEKFSYSLSLMIFNNGGLLYGLINTFTTKLPQYEKNW